MSNKEAVIFVLDSNESMNQPYPKDSENPSTRLDCAKQTIQNMISDLMIRSKTHEVCVIVLKTTSTHHHFYGEDNDARQGLDHDDEDADQKGIPFPNITEYGGDGTLAGGVSRPTPELLRQICKIQSSESSSPQSLRGDFCDGIIVGADALYRRTNGKKYIRRIVLVSDVEHEVQVDSKQLLVVLDSLRAMECRLEVIGLDFDQEAEFAQPVESAATAKIKAEPNLSTNTPPSHHQHQHRTANGHNDQADNSSEESNSEDEVDELEYMAVVKQQNERLLIGLTEKTGGFVMAAKDVQQILNATLGKRVPKSIRRKFTFQIAPGLVLETARFSLLISKASAPSLTKQVCIMTTKDDVREEPTTRKNALAQEMTSDIQTIVSHWDPEHEDEEVTDIAYAFRYGSDLVPMGGYDLQGLTKPSPVCLKILGYLDRSKVPRELLIGPPYAISGADSTRACATISALARALARTDQVGIGTMVKTKDADPILVGIFPLQDKLPIHLVVLQLPFKGEVRRFQLSSFDDIMDKADKRKTQACDDLIDALMLPQGVMNYSHIPNPFLRSFHKTVVKRSIDPNCKVVSLRGDENDLMVTPPEILNRARASIETFQAMFPLTKVTKDEIDSAPKRKRGPATYRDFLED